MRKLFLFFVLLSFLAGLQHTAFSKDNASSKKKFEPITGILTEVTKMSLTIETPDGKKTTYMRGFKLKLPEKVGMGSLVTIRINPILNVVKSIESGTGKGK